MSLSTRSAALALLAISAFAQRPARAEPPSASGSAGSVCAQAYEQAQELRQSGKLLQARVQLESCAQDVCPDFIRNDCVTWDGEIRTEIPTVVFAARSAGRDLSAVRVSLGQRLLASHIDGEAIELDPGEYDFEFAVEGMPPVTEHVLLARGERNRLLRAEFGAPSNSKEPSSDTELASPAPTRSWVLPAVFGGLGALGLAGFGAFGAWGHAGESSLKVTCSPHCSKDQIASVRTKYTAADASLAVGVVSLGLATYFALRASPERSAAQGSPLDVQANAHGFSATYREAF
ncbi:MAG: hypothetical protein ABJB12_01960 [Pseudomonadota bacterium]